jgi:hypothetical protein
MHKVERALLREKVGFSFVQKGWKKPELKWRFHNAQRAYIRERTMN